MDHQFNKGDIIQGRHRARDEAYHPIVYFKELNNEYFIGGMITHAKAYGNIQLLDSHFERKINSDSRPNFFVKNYLIKKMEWSPFKLIGRLSKEGVNFVTSHLNGTEPQVWEDYLFDL
jgi:hypothetical protein